LTDPPPRGKAAMNTFFETLRGVRLTGGIFLDAEFTVPWCVSAKVEPQDCARFMPVPRHIIAYHYIATGNCLLTVDGQPSVSLTEGEIVILPRNAPHILADAPGVQPITPQLIQAEHGGGLARVVHGGGGAPTHILCGFLGTDDTCNTTIAMLPEVLKLDARADWTAAAWIESSFRYAALESSKVQFDACGAIAKLAELLFFEAVRRYLVMQPQERLGLVASANDVLIGRALQLLREQIHKQWTTEELATAVGLSRSAFAERFARATGEPPMHYLTRQRLGKASGMLRESSESIGRIAGDVGYSSEASFTRAFRKAYGAPPGTWRRAAQGTKQAR
jgi:AraC-like DNA-binding protein